MGLVHEDVALGDWGTIPSIEHILQCAADDERDPLLVGLSGWARPSPEDLTQALQHAKHVQRELGWTDRVLDQRYKPLIPKLSPNAALDDEKKPTSPQSLSPLHASAISPIRQVPEALSKALAENTGTVGSLSDVNSPKLIAWSR